MIDTLGAIPGLTARLANSQAEVRAAQQLRFKIFFNELSGSPEHKGAISGVDYDEFDEVCDHLLVISDGKNSNCDAINLADGELVGTYRLLRQQVANKNFGFYSQNEFDVQPMLDRHRDLNFLELGRSCVLAPFRTKRAVELLWQGIWNFVRLHKHDVMFGCASLPGVDIAKHQLALSFLHHNFKPEPAWMVSAHTSCRGEINLLAANEINQRLALKSLPPLVKGYLRLGASIGDGAVIDHKFGTTDVLIILPVKAISKRYFVKFGHPND